MATVISIEQGGECSFKIECIDKYVIVTISYRVIYGIIVVILLLLKVSAFEWYCGAELGSECCAVLIASRFNKGLYFAKSNPVNKLAIEELKLNIS